MRAVVIPLFGATPDDLANYLDEVKRSGCVVVIVDNDPDPSWDRSLLTHHRMVCNRNIGGIAGGLNRGVEAAIAYGAQWITLLDQDSRILPSELEQLQEPWTVAPGSHLVVGPVIWDSHRQKLHGRIQVNLGGYQRTRLLISSGTTFRVVDWPMLGNFHEGLVIDFVDHAWCFRAQARGFVLLQHPAVVLHQEFGTQHPNAVCRWAGLQLYSPTRHYYSLRNLRWLILQRSVPIDLKIKETLKMLIKPFLWLVFEPRRLENLFAIFRGLFDPLPGPY